MKLIKYTLFTIIILVAGCKSIQLPKERALLKMPESFAILKDSSNAARINWKEFFNDDDLVALIDTALQNNLDVLSAYQNVEIAKANLRYNKGLLLPTVSANIGASLTKYGDYTQEWAGNKTTEIVDGKIIPQHLPDYLLGFSSSWEADIWGKLKNRKQAAQARYLASIEGKNWLQTMIIAEIANNYFEILALDNEIEILKQNITLKEQSLAIVKIQKEASRSNELAVAQFEAQILNTKTEVQQLLQIIVEIEGNINLLMGRYPQNILRNKSNLDNALYSKINEGIPSQLLQNRPDIRLAEQELFASRFDVMVAKKLFYPSLNINAGIALNGFSPSLLLTIPSMAYKILGGLTTPIFNRNSLKAEFGMATALQQKAIYNYQKTVITGFTEVSNQLKLINNLKQIDTFKQEEVSTLDSAITYSNLLFQANRVNYLEIIITQQNALHAKIDLIQNLKRQRQSIVNLYKALGGGW